MTFNLKTLLNLASIVIFVVIAIVMLVLFLKTKRKPCVECGTINKKGKVCSKCGNPIITKKSKIFLLMCFCSLLLTISSLTFFIHDLTIIEQEQSNQRDYSIPQLIIETEYINIRESRSVNSNILGKVYLDEIYTILSHDDNSSFDWYEIETSTGIRGFIAGKSNGVSYIKLLEQNQIIDEEEVEDNKKEETPVEKPEESKPVNKPTTKPNNSQTQNNKPSTSEPAPLPPKEEETIPPVDSTPEEPTPEVNPPVQEPEVIEPEKKQISATKEYYCESFSYDYKSITKTCEKEVYTSDESVRKVNCPIGYEPGIGSLCEDHTERETVIDPIETVTCSTGSSNLYNIGGQLGCRTGYLMPDYRCPYGYKLTVTSVGGVSFKRCVWNKPSTVKGTYSCVDGYSLTSSDQCYKKIVKDALEKYKCPEGYTLDGDMCYEN